MSATCPAGATCYYGTQHYEACPIGTYGKFDMLDASTGGSRNCETCPAGYTCATTGMTVPTPCGKGFYSAAGSSAATCTQCELGYYCEREDTTDTTKTLCGDGYECPVETTERPFYDHEDQWDIGNKYSCPLGNYCTGGVAIECDAGKYNPLYGAATEDGCLMTPAGFYTKDAGTTDFITYECP